MVPAPAPRAHREAALSAPNDWTRSYRVVGASRTLRRSVFVMSLAVCALTTAGSWNRTLAESPQTVVSGSSQASHSPLLTGPKGAHLSIAATPKLKTAIARANKTLSATQPAPVKRFAYGVPSASGLAVAKAPVANLQPLTLEVHADGKVRTLKVAGTHGATLGQALSEAKFAFSPTDRLSPVAGTPVRSGMVVNIVRIQSALRTRQETIPFEVRYKPTPKIQRGTTQTQPGHTGIISTTERVWKRDGKVTNVQFVERKVTRPVQHTIVALGTKPSYMPNNVPYHRRYARAYALASPLASRGGSPRDRVAATAQATTPWDYQGNVAPTDPGTLRAVKSLTVTATGYAAGPAGGAIGNRTATGLPCGYGAVAVDPRVIPLGSKLYIEGYGYGVACDTGGAIKGNRIDLAFDSVRAAFQLGRRSVKVWILQ